jgi:hypothetical protein
MTKYTDLIELLRKENPSPLERAVLAYSNVSDEAQGAAVITLLDLEDWAMKMTQVDDDPLKAFEQWEQERIALQDFYELLYEADRLLEDKRGKLSEIRKLMYADRREDAMKAINDWLEAEAEHKQRSEVANMVTGQLSFLGGQ